MAVSKGQEAEKIRAAIRAGQFLFGENRVQEAHKKWPALRREFPQIELHLIGPLQTNKAAEALSLFDVIQTLDRPKLAETFAKSMNGVRTREFFIQVNIGKEPQKSGIAPEEAPDFHKFCAHDLALPVTGLMCIPPEGVEARPYFRQLREMAANMGLPQLSMGMSGDFDIAAEEGATIVRVGTALFGAR